MLTFLIPLPLQQSAGGGFGDHETFTACVADGCFLLASQFFGYFGYHFAVSSAAELCTESWEGTTLPCRDRLTPGRFKAGAGDPFPIPHTPAWADWAGEQRAVS